MCIRDRFKNKDPGRLAQVMQVFAIDGKKVSVLKFSMSFSCENVVQGPRQKDFPAAAISFFDKDRKELKIHNLGPHKGTKDWLDQSIKVRVPHSAKEAIVRIGMWGSTGTARFDNVKVEKVE